MTEKIQITGGVIMMVLGIAFAIGFDAANGGNIVGGVMLFFSGLSIAVSADGF